MELTVLGSGTCIPTVDRGPSGLVLSITDHLIFFDGGGGSLRQMPRLGLDYRQIDYCCITHFHPDHVSDLVPLLFALNYTVDFTRSLPLHLLGPNGLRNFYDQMHGIFRHWVEAQHYSLQFHEGGESRFDFSDFVIRTLPLAHSAQAIGYRLEAGSRSMAYSGDTDYCENMVRLGQNADLMVLECSFPEERRAKGHLTPQLAARIAREASCKKLLLTHFYPVFQGHDIKAECQSEFSGEVVLAVDGLKINI